MVGLLNIIERPTAAGLDIPVTLTVPVKPRLFRASVEVVDPLATKLSGDGCPAMTVKSPVIVNDCEDSCDVDPLDPTTRTR